MNRLVTVEIEDSVATVRLDRPPLNTFDDLLCAHLTEAIRSIADARSVGAVVITGNDKAFAAGADLKQLAELDYERIVGWNRALQRVFTDIAQLPMPVVAAVNGFALGGGMELALAADFRILGSNATLALPEILLGIVPGAGGMQRLQRLVGTPRAKELVMTGRRLSAAEALDLGIAEQVVPREDVLTVAHEFAASLARGPRFALSAVKQALDLGQEGSLEVGLALDRSLLAGMFATQDRLRGMTSFLENGPGHARFGSETGSA
ncbi:enoyl-CoA hydratase/isomerase family protein [Rhodococcus indonesiensis]